MVIFFNIVLVSGIEKLEKYCPVVQDVTIEDEELCAAVEEIDYQ